jgi:hypothetical protein
MSARWVDAVAALCHLLAAAKVGTIGGHRTEIPAGGLLLQPSFIATSLSQHRQHCQSGIICCIFYLLSVYRLVDHVDRIAAENDPDQVRHLLPNPT